MKYIFPLIFVLLTACASQEPADVEKPVDTSELVYIDNNAVQCESNGFSPHETAAILQDNGITVTRSFCGYLTGLVVAAVCGMGNSAINLHLINKGDLQEAGELGFLPVSMLVIAEDSGYVEADCPE